MSEFDDKQYRKLSQKISNTHSEREYNTQIKKLNDRDLKSDRRKR